jgi:hypothetical protein
VRNCSLEYPLILELPIHIYDAVMLQVKASDDGYTTPLRHFAARSTSLLKPFAIALANCGPISHTTQPQTSLSRRHGPHCRRHRFAFRSGVRSIDGFGESLHHLAIPR